MTEDLEDNFKCPFTDANIIAEYTKIHKIKVPILPNLSKVKEKVNYSGYGGYWFWGVPPQTEW